MGFDNAYEAITEESDDHRWAFGTGFTDPLSGVDTSLPPGVDGAVLGAYCLMLGDDALVMSHRLQQWLTRAPELEEETALANIALDLLGQARLLLSRAGTADGSGRTEDDYAFLREEAEFRNVQFVEADDADFAGLIARLLIFSTWRLAVFAGLRESRDPVLAAIAEQGVKEIAYHRDYAAQWVVRLGDGTPYSRERIEAALRVTATGLEELFHASQVELALQGVAVDPTAVREQCHQVLADVLAEARLAHPLLAGSLGASGRDGVHSPAMAPLLDELQGIARRHAGATW